LLVGARHLMEVRVVLARQLVEPSLQPVQVNLELPGKSEDREVVVHGFTKEERVRRDPFSLCPILPVGAAPEGYFTTSILGGE